MDNVRVLGAPDPGVTAEPNWGHANHHGASACGAPEARKEEERTARRWAQAEAVRATWTHEQFEEEEARIAAQIAEWEDQRNAA